MLTLLTLLISLTIANTSFPVLYEISTRPFLYELTQKYGYNISKIRDIPLQEFDALASMGIEIVWMMGAWQLGEYGLELDKNSNYSSVLPDWTEDDVIGSPFAITEYKCNNEIGSDDDLIWLKHQLHARGMKLMLDFVPNHSACDAPTTKTHPEYYVHVTKNTPKPYNETYFLPNGIAFGRDTTWDPWRDVAQWNYWETGLREFQEQNLLHIASIADAIRCDVAHLALNDLVEKTWKEEVESYGYSRPQTEFWEDAISLVKSVFPTVIFLAEAYEVQYEEKLKNCGFDYYYNKELLDAFKDTSTTVDTYMSGLSDEYLNYSAHFVENHDESRAVEVLGTVEKANAAATIAATIPGLIFFNHNQFKGYRNKLDVHLRRATSEDTNQVAVSFYDKLTSLISTYDAFKKRNGFHYISDINGDLADSFISYIREGSNSEFLVVVNYGETEGCANIPIYDIEGNSNNQSVVREVISDVSYIRDTEVLKSTGLSVCLESYGVQVFEYNSN